MQPKKIYVVRRADGTYWADYVAQGHVVNTFNIDTLARLNRTVARPGEFVPERVKALARRRIDELTEVPRIEVVAPVEVIKPRPWWKFWN